MPKLVTPMIVQIIACDQAGDWRSTTPCSNLGLGDLGLAIGDMEEPLLNSSEGTRFFFVPLDVCGGDFIEVDF